MLPGGEHQEEERGGVGMKKRPFVRRKIEECQASSLVLRRANERNCYYQTVDEESSSTWHRR